MTVKFEFIGYCREKTGRKEEVVEVKERGPDLYTALTYLQVKTGGALAIVENDGLVKGLLVFQKNERGALSRQTDLSVPLSGMEQFVLATGMEGG